MLDTGMVIVYDEDWAAFYNNGVMEVQGDSYYVEEHVFRLLGVRQHSSESLVNPRTNSAWETLTELETVEAHDREGD
jgi:hypothetical protein